MPVYPDCSTPSVISNVSKPDLNLLRKCERLERNAHHALFRYVTENPCWQPSDQHQIKLYELWVAAIMLTDLVQDCLFPDVDDLFFNPRRNHENN